MVKIECVEERGTENESVYVVSLLERFSCDVVFEETFVPAVIEPSFGLGRIIYCILEHTFRSRGIEVRFIQQLLNVVHLVYLCHCDASIQDQEERCFFSLPICIAPVKCSLLSISSDAKFHPVVSTIKSDLTRLGVSCKVDQSGASIGK